MVAGSRLARGLRFGGYVGVFLGVVAIDRLAPADEPAESSPEANVVSLSFRPSLPGFEDPRPDVTVSERQGFYDGEGLFVDLSPSPRELPRFGNDHTATGWSWTEGALPLRDVVLLGMLGTIAGLLAARFVLRGPQAPQVPHPLLHPPAPRGGVRWRRAEVERRTRARAIVGPLAFAALLVVPLAAVLPTGAEPPWNPWAGPPRLTLQELMRVAIPILMAAGVGLAGAEALRRRGIRRSGG